MLFAYFLKNLRLLPLLALPFLAWLLPPETENGELGFSSAKVNLALRRTADGLLRAAGDSTSRIPAVEEVSAAVWRLRLEQPFQYDQLPALLQSSLDLHGIRRQYDVAVRRCTDAAIILGYHQLDFRENDENVPCGGRKMPKECYFIEITFLEPAEKTLHQARTIGVLTLLLGGFAGFWLFRRRKNAPTEPANAEATDDATDWLEFGNSRLDVAGQLLVCGSNRQMLTFREAKLLRLFAASPDRLLERDFIIQQVWADEGVLVGRSVDVFVSRLRKKLAADPTVGIVAVHGVGYRLETGKAAG